MHPDVNPQKLAPTNKTPRTGKKSNKRKFLEDANNLLPIEIDSNSHLIIRNVQFTTASTNMTNVATTENSTTVDCDQPESSEHSISIVHSINSTNDLNNAQINSSTNKQNNTTFELIENGSFVCNQINQNHINHTSNLSNLNDDQTENVQSEEITNAIVNLVVRDCRPIDLVTGKHFKELIKLLAPNYKLPDIVKLEQLVKKKITEVRRDLILKSMDDE